MRVTGKVVSGAMSGAPFVEHHFYQIVAEIGYEPYKGTLDIKLPSPLDIEQFVTKRVSRVLRDGTNKTDAMLAEVLLVVDHGDKETRHKCWAIRRGSETFGNDTIEIIDRENLRGKYKLDDGTKIELIFGE